MTEKFCVVLTFINSINLHHTKFICNFVASKKTPKYTPKMIIKRITLKNYNKEEENHEILQMRNLREHCYKA